MDGRKINEFINAYEPQYANFDLSYEYKGSGNFGWLMPVFFKDVIPGDTFHVNTEVMVRFAPLLAPIMHRVNVYMHYFEVPNRIIWDQWESFITGGDDGTSSETFPTVNLTSTNQMNKNNLADFFGLPVQQGALTNGLTGISKLPFAAYFKIWDEYYRDQNLQTPVFDETANEDAASLGAGDIAVKPYKRAWEKDYFTSALPNLQKNTASSVAVTVSENITYLSQATTVGTATSTGLYTNASKQIRDDLDTLAVGIDNIDNLGLTATVDINDLRLAARLQEWWERRSRGGSRYVEMIKSEFSITPSDRRLMRPRYLGGGKQQVVISEVMQTSEDGTTPLGEMAGHGIAVGGNNSFDAFFEEYGIVLGIMSIMPRAAYTQRVDRYWFQDDRFDFPFPAFAHLGEQPVYNKEVYYDASTSGDDPDGTFGYQQRYAQYKQSISMITGDFRDDLAHWHLGRIFTAEPSLNEDFIQLDHEDEGISSRAFATQNLGDNDIWFQLYHQVHARRPLPYFSNPNL
jgi:hypothetical protein